MLWIRALSLVAVVTMIGVIAYGMVSGDFSGEGGDIIGLAWGRVTLVDLYVGLALFGAWIAFRETSGIRIVLWWLALVVLGNLASAIYLAIAAFTSSNPRDLMMGRRG